MTQAEGLIDREIGKLRGWYNWGWGIWLLLSGYAEDYTMESLILAQDERQRQA